MRVSTRLRRLIVSLAAGLVAAAGLTAAYTWAWEEAPLERSDTASYFEVAADLQDFRLEYLYSRTPGYPMWLRLLGFSDGSVTRRLVAAQVSLHLVTAAILALALLLLGLPRRFAAVFLGLAWLPPFAQQAAYVLSETLAQFFLVLTVAALAVWWRSPAQPLLWLAGFSLAGAALTRPIFQALAPGIAIALAWALLRRRSGQQGKLRTVMPAATFFGCAVLPWFLFALYNWQSFGEFTTSQGSLPHALSTKTVRVLERLPEEYAIAREAMIVARDQHLVARGSSHTAEQYYPTARAAVSDVTGKQGRELDRYLMEIQGVLIARAPAHYAEHVLQSGARFWFPRVTHVIVGGWRSLQLVWSALQAVVFAVFFLQLAVLGGLLIFRASLGSARSSRLPLSVVPGELLFAWLLPLIVVFYTMAISSLVHHGDPRFRAPTELLILFGGVVGLWIWFDLRLRIVNAASRS